MKSRTLVLISASMWLWLVIGIAIPLGSITFVAQAAHLGEPWDTSEPPTQSLSPMPTPRASAAVGVIGGQLYVVGGATGVLPGATTVLEVYDPGTNTWNTTKAVALRQRAGMAAGVVDGKFYVAGGCINSDCRVGATNILEVFDPAAGPSGTWTELAPMPGPRFLAAAEVIDGKLYVVGGLPGGTCCPYLNTMVVYDPVIDNWDSSLSPMPTGRGGAAAVIDGKLYVVGGGTGSVSPPTNVSVNTLEVYDPAFDAWSTLTPMPTARQTHAVSAIDGKLYVVGGVFDDSTTGTVDHVLPSEVYDPATDTWSTVAPMPTPREQVIAGVIDGEMYVPGGLSVVGTPPVPVIRDTLEIFTPEGPSIPTPAEATQDLIDEIIGSGLPKNIRSSLTGPLAQATNTLNDTNPNNDTAACGGLNAFVNQVNAKEKSGKVTAGEAEFLRQSATAIQASLNCR